MEETAYDVRKGLQKIKDFMNKHENNLKPPPSIMKKLQKLYKCTEKKSVSIEIMMKVEQAIDQLKFHSSENKTDDSSNRYSKSSNQRTYEKYRDIYRYDDSRSHSRHEYKVSSSQSYQRDKRDRSRSTSRSKIDRNDKYYRQYKDQGKYKHFLDRGHSRNFYEHDDRKNTSDSDDDISFKKFPNQSPNEPKNVSSMSSSNKDRSPHLCSRSKNRSKSLRYRTHAPDRSGNNTRERNCNENKSRMSRSPLGDGRSSLPVIEKVLKN